MCSTTWTPPAVASDSHPVELQAWRAVEAQHLVATLALVDSLDEQHELEALLEASKPMMQQPLPGLHWLLFTPFRYPPLPTGSRFRGPGHPGVLYAAEEIRTACAELGYWRWRFLMDSPDLVAISAKPQTVFRLAVAASAVDLRAAPFCRDRVTWTHASDYSGCQSFAATARDAGVTAIRYESVRDPQHGACIAVLAPTALAAREPLAAQTWLLSVTRAKVFWHRNNVIESSQLEFSWSGDGAVPQPPATRKVRSVRTKGQQNR